VLVYKHSLVLSAIKNERELSLTFVTEVDLI